MVTLFVKTGCPYCQRVERVVDALKIDVTYKNISEPGVWDEIVERGGKHQVPYMVHDEAGVSMYESSDIVNYLCEQFGGNPEDFSEAVAHVCPI